MRLEDVFPGPPPPEPHEIVPTHLSDPRVQEHVANLRTIIRRAFPEVKFSVYEASEPALGVWLDAYIADDEADLPTLARDYELEVLDREGLSLFVETLPLRPLPSEAA